MAPSSLAAQGPTGSRGRAPSLLLLLAAAAGPRARAQVVLPAAENCFIGSGFSFDDSRGCSAASAVQAMLPCDPDSPTDAPCVRQVHEEDMISYTRNVADSDEHATLMKAITSAEGGGFGVTVSVGVNYMQQSQTTESSVAFFVGASGQSRKDSILNTVNLKLNDGAKALLKSDPLEFLRTHGSRYVYSVLYGGSFLGSFTLNSRSSTSMSSFGISTKFEARNMYFDVGVSADFEASTKDLTEEIRTYSSAKWQGGNGVSLDPSSPHTLGETFLQWNRTFRTYPKALLIVLRNWVDFAEVQAIVRQFPDAIQNAFNAPEILQITRDKMSEENGRVQLVRDSVSFAKTWDVVKASPQLQDRLAALDQKAESHMVAIATVGEIDLFLRQSEVKAGNYSWFIADDLQKQFRALVAGLPKPTGADVWSMLWGTSNMHREKWADIDMTVQAVVFDPIDSLTYIVKGGMVQSGESWRRWTQVDSSVHAAWLWGAWLYLVKDGQVCRVTWGSQDPCNTEPWPYIDENVEAAWVADSTFYVIKAGLVCTATWGSSDYNCGAWSTVDATVKTAWLENDTFYVLKPSLGMRSARAGQGLQEVMI